MNAEDRIISETEMVLLISEMDMNHVVKFDFGSSGTRLSQSNSDEVYEKLEEIRDLMLLNQYHPQFKNYG